MKYSLIAFLICASSVFAQPLGPIPLPYGGSELQVVKHESDLFEVFYRGTSNFSLMHYTFNLDSIGAEVDVQTVNPGGQYWNNYFDAVAVTADEKWVAVVRTSFHSSGGITEHESYLINGFGNQVDSQTLIYEQIEDHGEFFYYGPLIDCRFAARPDSGFVLTGVSIGRFGIEPLAEVYVFADPAQTVPFHHFGDSDISLFPHATSQDTALILYYGAMQGFAEAELYLNCQGEDTCYSIVEYPEVHVWPAIALLTTHGRYLIVTSYGFGIYTINESGELETTAQLPVNGWDLICDSHPEFGIACAYQEYNQIKLVRIDTTGALFYSPVTLVYEPLSGDLTSIDLNNNGEITISWGNDRMVVADWNDPLDSPEDPRIPLPESVSLSAYPNPFNSEVRIEYSLPNTGDVNLSIYNLQGQLVEQLENSRMSAGDHAVSWQPNTTSGVYFVHLQTKTSAMTQKILYLR